MMLQNQIVPSTKRFFMQKGKNSIIIVLILIILILLFPYAASLIEGNDKTTNNIKTLTLDDYQIGYMIETGDFMLWNRKSNTIDYCITDSVSKTIHLQIMKIDQMNYNQYFEKTKKEKK